MKEPKETSFSTSDKEFLLREQTCLLLENTKTAFAVNTAIAFLTFLAIRLPECAWLGLVVLVSCLRLLFFLYYRKKAIPASNYSKIHLYLLILITLQGLSWGAASIFIYLAAEDIHKFYLIAIVCGMSGGSILTLAPSFTAFVCFTLTAVSPLVIALLGEAKAGFLPAGLMGVVFLFAVLYLSRRINSFHVDLLLTNRTLDWTAQELALHKNRLEKLVAERTEELKGSRENYRRLTEEINEAIYELDCHGVFRYVSPVIETLLGYAPDQLIDRPIIEILSEEDRSLFEKAMAKAGRNGNHPVDCRAKTASGEFRWVRSSFRPIGEDGISGGVRGVIGDIEGQKKAEIEKDKLLQRFYEHQKLESLATFAGGVAHEFNNLLMGIQGHASLLAMKLAGSDNNQQHLKIIDEQVRRAKQLTTQLLGSASLGKYDPRTLDINRLVSRCAFLFGRKRAKIHIEESLHESPLLIEGDSQQIEQALWNLFVNAVEAMADMDGHAKVSVKSSHVMLDASECQPYGLAAGGYAKLSVTDGGRGMDEITKQRIFDPFFTTKNDGKQAGLGLAATYGIIKNHGGFITVESTPGQGATFEIFLPLTDKKLHTAEKPVAVEDTAGGSETILLVDDEVIIQNVGRALLERLGYNVIIAENGEKAVESVHQYGGEIDLVILDMIMPGMDGNMTFDEIRTLQPSMPVLLASGYSLDSYAKEIMAKGCNGFLQKPFSLADLSQKIREILDGP